MFESWIKLAIKLSTKRPISLNLEYFVEDCSSSPTIWPRLIFLYISLIYHGYFSKNGLIAAWDWFWDFEEQQNIIQKNILQVA